MQLQDYKNWYDSTRDFEEGKALYLAIPNPPDESLYQYLKSWSRSSFLEDKLSAGIKHFIDHFPVEIVEDQNLTKLIEHARELQESHKKLYYLLQQSLRISTSKRLHLALNLLDIADQKRAAWDAVDSYKENGIMPPDPEAPKLDIDINDALQIHEKLYQTNLNIFRHKNNVKKASLVQKHIKVRDYLTDELKKFKK